MSNGKCKLEGCIEDYVNQFGPYAQLCRTHKQERMDARRNGTYVPRRGLKTRERSLSLPDACEILTDKANELQDSIHARDRAKLESKEALEAFVIALENVKTVAQNLVGNNDARR